MGLHYILQHLDKPGNYARILFVDFSSVFNTIMPDLLSDKLTQLSVPTSICQWITSFLTDRQQLVRLGKLTSRTLTISTGAPQGCILSPLLFSLYTNDCTSKDPSVKLLKFEDDTTVIVTVTSLIDAHRHSVLGCAFTVADTQRNATHLRLHVLWYDIITQTWTKRFRIDPDIFMLFILETVLIRMIWTVGHAVAELLQR